MRRLVDRAAAGVASAVTAMLAIAACSQTVGGTAERARPASPGADRSYGYVADRCGLLHDDAVRDLLRATSVVKPFSGAVCRYVLATDKSLIDVVFSWFERGTTARERSVAAEGGARIVNSHPAFLTQHPDAPNACAATAGAGRGVVVTSSPGRCRR